jgi:hypothetical protein
MSESTLLEDTADKVSEMLAFLRNLAESKEITIRKRPPIDTEKRGGLSISEASEWLGMDRDSFKEKLVDTGILVARNVGTGKRAYWIVSTQSLNEFMTRRTR